jgi:uncharacterized protein YjdB
MPNTRSSRIVFHHRPCSRLFSLFFFSGWVLCAQTPTLSITNYQLVGSQTVQRTLNLTYGAQLTNTGNALPAVTAVVTSLSPALVVAAGQDTLQFTPVPANSQVISSNTFTIQTIGNQTIDFSQLQWTFETVGVELPASVSLAAGGSVSFPVTLGSPAPAGGVSITLASSNANVAAVSPSAVFVPAGAASPRGVATVTGNSAGSATISASATGYATANTQVLVTSGSSGGGNTMSFSPGSLTVNAGASQNLTLNLSAPAASALAVSLSSSNSSIASVPSTVSFAASASSVSVPVTGVAAGSVTITASAATLGSATASITVASAGGGIVLPSNLTLAPGNSASLPVSLATPAASSVSITLTSSNPAIASVFPASVSIPAGATGGRQTPAVTGNASGSATITASASGYANATAQVQVSGGTSTGLSLSFSPASLTINGDVTQNLTLDLSAPMPAGETLVVSLASSNTAVATVPSTVSFGSGTTLSVPITGVAPGSVTVTASAAGVTGAAVNVTIAQAAPGAIVLPSSLSVAPCSSVNFSVTLGSAAPSGGVSITLASTNTAIAAVSPATLTIPAGATSGSTAATVTGMTGGSASITASAIGYRTANTPVTVTRKAVNMMIVVDRSGSVVAEGAQPAIQTALAKFVADPAACSLLDGVDTVGLVSFGGTWNLDFAPQTHFQTATPNIGTAIDNIPFDSNSSTNTAEGLYQAWYQLYQMNGPDALNVIVLLTDGRPSAFTSNWTPSATSTCVNKAKRGGVFETYVGLGSYPFWPPPSSGNDSTGLYATHFSGFPETANLAPDSTNCYYDSNTFNVFEDFGGVFPASVGPVDNVASGPGYPPGFSTPGTGLSTRSGYYVLGNQSMLDPQSGRYAAFNAADNMATLIRQDITLQPTLVVIGLNYSGITEPLDADWLARVASDPNYVTTGTDSDALGGAGVTPGHSVYQSGQTPGIYCNSTLSTLSTCFAQVASALQGLIR